MIEIPENHVDFFQWVKNRTEAYWNQEPDASSSDANCEEWVRGAKWVGLRETQIDEVEVKYSIKFMPEHRDFLRILHTIDRKELIKYTEKSDASEDFFSYKHSFFYNWLEDGDEITSKLEWPYQTVFEDVLGPNKVWLKSWGTRPESEEDKKVIFAEWYGKAPKLIPITGHRFLVSDMSLKDRPILSVYGSDIIIYGWTFRHYLLNELQGHLNLHELVCSEDDKCDYWERIPGLRDALEFEESGASQKDIPYWKEMILYWSSGWSSFGLEFPRQGDSMIQPIVKGNIDDEEVFQKTFNGFQ